MNADERYGALTDFFTFSDNPRAQVTTYIPEFLRDGGPKCSCGNTTS